MRFPEPLKIHLCESSASLREIPQHKTSREEITRKVDEVSSCEF